MKQKQRINNTAAKRAGHNYHAKTSYKRLKQVELSLGSWSSEK